MENIKIIGIGIISLIITIIVKQYKPEFAIYMSLITGIIIISMAIGKLTDIVRLLTNLASRTSVNGKSIRLLIKITGIAILTEFGVSICKDAGESAIASKIDISGKIIIVAVSIPIISSLLETVTKVLP